MKNRNILFSGVGVLIIFACIVLANIILSKAPIRCDFTEDKLYTLSDNSKKILKKLDAEVVIDFYATKTSTAMPVGLKDYASRVEDMLNEYVQASGGMVTLFKHDPTPYSDAEDAAKANGITGQALPSGDKIYLGLAISCIDKTETIPFMNPSKETMMEYDITSIISRVMKESAPVIGLMSAIDMSGTPDNPMTRQPGRPAWVFRSELEKNYDVRDVALDIKVIPSDITTLIVVHPNGISEDTEYAIDQYLLNGGKMIAFVDPFSYITAMEAQQAGDRNAQAKIPSTFNKLLPAWGVTMDTQKVIGDTLLAKQNNGSPMVSILDLVKANYNKNDALTSSLNSMTMVFSGAFTGDGVSDLSKESLLTTSNNAGLLNTYVANNPQMAASNLASGETKQYDLAIRLSGKFPTAFPDKKDGLKEAKSEGYVILVADTDLLHDDLSVVRQRFLNQTLVRMRNNNLTFAQNAVDSFAGDSDLIGIRSRESSSRPFTVVKELEAAANKKFRKQIEEMEGKVRQAQQKINQLMSQNKGSSQEFIQSPAVQKEIKELRLKEVENRKKVKQLRKDLRKDINSLETNCKWLNIILMPVIVILIGLLTAIIRKRRSSAR